MILEYLKGSTSSLPVDLAYPVLVIFVIYVILKKAADRLQVLLIIRFFWVIQIVLLPLFVLSLEALVFNWLDPILDHRITGIITRIRTILLWLIFARIVVQAVDLFIWKGMVKRRTGMDVPNILHNLVRIGVYLLAIYGIMTFVFDRPVTGLLVSSGIIAGVIGLSMQTTLGDIFAGIALSIEKPYRINDWIEMEDGTLGKVVDINWRSTRLLSWNSSIYVIPNGKAMSATIHNYNLPDRIYCTWFKIEIAPEISPVLVRRVLLEAALSCKKVLKEPPPAVRLSDGSKRPYLYSVFVYFDDYPTYFAARDDLFMEIWNYCQKAGITPPPTVHEVNYFTGERSEVSEPGLDELISNVEIFSPLTKEERDELLKGVSLISFRENEVIVREGDTGDSLMILTAGVISVSRRDSYGKPVELERLGTGDCFGENSLLTGERRSATIVALTDCQAMEFSREDLAPILEKRPEIIEELAKVMASRKLETESRLQLKQRKSTGELLGDYGDEILHSISSFFGMK
ncbi:MAG: cyclic nucleotide-binding domain-containing protein [Spirochaetota bacterium]